MSNKVVVPTRPLTVDEIIAALKRRRDFVSLEAVRLILSLMPQG